MALLLKSAAVPAVAGVRKSTGRVANVRAPVVCSAGRDTWYPGATAPSHLDGTLVGDRGFDPLRLGVDKERLLWFAEAEKTNGRWAMAAVAGILFTDLVGLPKWWLAGAESYALDNTTLALIEVAAFAFLEAKRYQGFKKTGSSGFLSFFPFDPLKMSSPQKELQEVKNGRLAMLALVGFASVAAVRGLGPIDALKLHLENPWANNIYSTSVGPETALTVVLLSVWPMIIEGIKKESANKDAPPFPWNEPWKQQ